MEQLEKMTSDIEFSQIQLEVVEGLRIGNESLKQLNQLLNVEDIENLLDETREGAKKQEVSFLALQTFGESLMPIISLGDFTITNWRIDGNGRGRLIE